MTDDKPAKETEFNSSQATLERIDKNFRVAADARYGKRYDIWLPALDNNWQEIAVYLLEMPAGFEEKLSESREKCSQHIRTIEHCQITLKETYDSKLINIIGHVKYLLEKELDNYQRLIRVVCKKKGLLMTDKPSASEAAYQGE